MAASDSTSLAELADYVAATAKEVVGLCERITRASKTTDLQVDKTYTLGRCVVDACSFLALQLRDLSTGDENAFTDADEKFWPTLRLVMDLWLENAEKSVEILGRDHRLQTSLTSRIWQSMRASAEFTSFGPPKLQEGTLEDIKMVTTLLALHKEMQKDIDTETRLGRHFLACDLEWKATQLQMRMSHIRQQLKPPLAWGRTHERLVDASMDLVGRAKRELGVPSGDCKFMDT